MSLLLLLLLLFICKSFARIDIFNYIFKIQLLREVFDKNLSQELRPVINGNSIRMMITPEFDLLISLVNADKGTSVLTESAAANYVN